MTAPPLQSQDNFWGDGGYLIAIVAPLLAALPQNPRLSKILYFIECIDFKVLHREVWGAGRNWVCNLLRFMHLVGAYNFS
jgi:hypothetical protein